jgi:hypothetical protein
MDRKILIPARAVMQIRAGGRKIKLLDGWRGFRSTEHWLICVCKHMEKTEVTLPDIKYWLKLEIL